MPTVVDPIETGREQLQICRHEIILGARRLRAQAAPSVEDAHLMADAILEYFTSQVQLEALDLAERDALREAFASLDDECSRLRRPSLTPTT